MLWDIGEYEVSDSFSDSDSDEERSKKRRRTSVEDEDPLVPLRYHIYFLYTRANLIIRYGRHEEDKLRDRLNPERMIPHGKQRTFRLILKNGRKVRSLRPRPILSVLTSQMKGQSASYIGIKGLQPE